MKDIKIGKATFKFIFMNHWGSFHFIPNLNMSVSYSVPTFTFQWMVFRVDMCIYRHLPEWFMKYVWSIMNFDFLVKKEDTEDY